MTKNVSIDAAESQTADSFHDTFAETFGFPDFYGRNMNAIAVILAKPLGQGEKEWAVLSGKGKVENDTLYLELNSGQERFEIRKEWLQRIARVWANAPAPYSESELYLSLALNAFPNDTPPQKLMEMARKLPGR